jgi:hypothetical protein
MSKQSINWISEEEAAGIFGLTTRYFREAVTAKNKFPIKYSRVSKKKILYNKADIDNWIYENSNMAF